MWVCVTIAVLAQEDRVISKIENSGLDDGQGPTYDGTCESVVFVGPLRRYFMSYMYMWDIYTSNGFIVPSEILSRAV